MGKSMRKRFFHCVQKVSSWFFIGMAYFSLISFTSFRIPCMFYTLTGLKCPGCGVTRMFLAMLQGNFYLAWMENPFLFILVPVLSLYYIWKTIWFIITGKCFFLRYETQSLFAILISLILFGIVRNSIVHN